MSVIINSLPQSPQKLYKCITVKYNDIYKTWRDPRTIGHAQWRFENYMMPVLLNACRKKTLFQIVAVYLTSNTEIHVVEHGIKYIYVSVYSLRLLYYSQERNKFRKTVLRWEQTLKIDIWKLGLSHKCVHQSLQPMTNTKLSIATTKKLLYFSSSIISNPLPPSAPPHCTRR